MRLLLISAVAVLMLVPEAFAEEPQTPSTTIQQPTLEQVQRDHPGWFTEPNTYKPCPANVEFASGREGCL
jgi:hypothetical protein